MHLRRNKRSAKSYHSVDKEDEKKKYGKREGPGGEEEGASAE